MVITENESLEIVFVIIIIEANDFVLDNILF